MWYPTFWVIITLVLYENKTDNNLERWVSMKEITAYLGINRDTALNQIAKRRMPAVKVGRL